MTHLTSLFVAVAVLVGQAFILKKMGEEFWKGLIPVYGTYLLFKKVWNTKMFIVLIVSSMVLGGCMGAIGQCWQAGINTGIVVPLMGMALIMAFSLAVEGIVFMYRLAKAFGHGVGYTIGLIFLEPVFTLLLGLNKDKYQVLA